METLTMMMMGMLVRAAFGVKFFAIEVSGMA